jgi:hypothetical protein
MSNLEKMAISVLREMFYDHKIQIITTNKLMAIAQSLNSIRYVTNVEGKTTDVLVPMEIWQQIIHTINTDESSGLAWIDEQEPKTKILADLQESLELGAKGETFPIFQLWEYEARSN